MVELVITKSEYDEMLKNNALLMVDYFATWCSPCEMIAPKIEEFAKAFLRIKFIKVDVDASRDIYEAEGISAVPTFKLFKDGVKVGEVVGARAEMIKAELEKLAA